MRQLFIVGLALAFAFAVVGCGGGFNAAKAEKYWSTYYNTMFEQVKAKKDIDNKKCEDEALKAVGYKDLTTFSTDAAKWNATEYAAIVKKQADAYAKKVEEHAKGAADKPAEKPEEK